MTGEQTITQGGAWQAVAGATGAIILQNQGNAAIQYFIGGSAPSTEKGVDLRGLNAHTPNIRASETLYARSEKTDALLVWSE